MTDAEEEEILAKAATQMFNRIKHLVGWPMDRKAFNMITDVIEAARRRLKHRYGIKLSKLVALVIPSIGFLHITRSDRDQNYIERLILEIVRANPAVDKQELAVAVMTAFPQYRPGERAGRAIEGIPLPQHPAIN